MIDGRAVIAVALGAALGGALRYVVGQLFLQRFGPGFPYGTLFINVTGCFLIGVLAQLAETRALGVTPLVRMFATTGVLGGYTTFSTFALDATILTAEGGGIVALAYVLASVVLGLTGAVLGQIVARLAIG